MARIPRTSNGWCVIDALHGGVATVVALLAGALVVGVAALRLRVPYVVALLIAAVPLEVPHLDENFTPSLLFVFLPALIFEAAWNVDARSLLRNWAAIAMLAVVGVLLTALFVAGGLALTGLLPFVPALVLGATLAATDPIAVLATFRRFAVSPDLTTIVEGESLFNDGVAIALYTVAVGALASGATHIDSLAVGGHALRVGGGGIAVGLACAGVMALVLRGVKDTVQPVVGTLVVAYGSYLIAEALHLSGTFGAVAAGIALRAMHRSSAEATTEIDRFWAVLAFIATTLVFVLMGLRIEFARIIHEPRLVILTLVLVSVARVLVTYAGLPLAGIGRDRVAWQTVVLVAGMRGALSVALALALPIGIPYRRELIDTVFGVVLVTLVVQGLAIAPLLFRLRLAKRNTVALGSE